MEIILGVLASGFVQLVKKYLPNNEWATLSLTALVSILAAAGYSYLVANNWWDSLYTILTTAGAFYAFILLRFKD